MESHALAQQANVKFLADIPFNALGGNFKAVISEELEDSPCNLGDGNDYSGIEDNRHLGGTAGQVGKYFSELNRRNRCQRSVANCPDDGNQENKPMMDCMGPNPLIRIGTVSFIFKRNRKFANTHQVVSISFNHSNMNRILLHEPLLKRNLHQSGVLAPEGSSAKRGFHSIQTGRPLILIFRNGLG